MSRSPARAFLLSVLLALGGCLAPPGPAPGEASPFDWTATGQVIDWDGHPVPNATVTVHDGAFTTTNDTGWFQVPARGRWAWLEADHPDHHARVRAAWPDDPLLFRLSPSRAVVVNVVGDVMFDRRFYDPDWVGPVLHEGHEAEELPALLGPIAPLLGGADLSLANLETALGRGLERNPGKGYTFLSHPAAASALHGAGVDVLTLGNNHVVDGLGPGVQATLDHAEAAGLWSVGAGMDDDGAWRRIEPLPGVFVTACTDLLGDGEMHNLARPGKPGAADCDELAGRAVTGDGIDLLVAHSGGEFTFDAKPWTRIIVERAAALGFDAVLVHHSHAGGGLGAVEGVPVAWSLGNFAFDSIIWPSEFTVLAQLHAWDGEVQRLLLEPLVRDATMPEPLPPAGAVPFLRRLAAESDAVVLEDGALELDLHGRAITQRATRHLESGVQRLDGVLETSGLETGWDLAPVAPGVDRIMGLPSEPGAWLLDGRGGPPARIQTDGGASTLRLEGTGTVAVRWTTYDGLESVGATGRGAKTVALPGSIEIPAAGAVGLRFEGEARITGMELVAWAGPEPWATHVRVPEGGLDVVESWTGLPGGWGMAGPWEEGGTGAGPS